MKGHSTESPLIAVSTPKRSPIMDVVQSPLAQKLKQLSEQRTVIEKLNNELDTEQAEKVMLQEELQQERDKTKKLTRQLIDRKDEMKKLREEWFYNDFESNQKAQCGNSCQETLLKKQIKDLETYISSLHGDIDMLHNKQDLLQQRVLKAEHQNQVWYAESQRNEALSEKLKLDAAEKECELAHTKELCSELQRHVQEIKQVHNISVEEDPCFTSPGCRTPENLCQAVIDLRLQEQLEENKIITKQLKKLIIEEEVMKKQIRDLQIRSDTTECEADILKATNLELQGKVDKMEALQHEFEECRTKQACLSQELDVLSQIYAEERQAHENDVQNLKSELRNAEASRDKLKRDYSTSETERESMLALKIKLEKKINILNVEIADVKSCLLLLKEQQEDLNATHNKQIEEKEETIPQLVKKFSVLQDEIYSLEDVKRDLGTQLHAANSGLSELHVCKEHLLHLYNNMKDENKILQLTKISLDRKVEELLHEMNTVIEELEKVKASELLLQENKLYLLEQHSEELHKREAKINMLLKVEHCLNEEKKKMDLMQTQMNEFMCDRKIVSELCNVLRENVSSLQAVVASVQDQNTHEERDVGQKVLISKTVHMDGICKESIGDDTDCLHMPYDYKMRLPAEQWSSYSVTDINVYTGELGSKGDESAVNTNLLEKSSDLLNSQNLCLEEESIPLEAELAGSKISISELQMDHKEDIDTNVSEVVNNLEILNADLVSTRGEIMQILKSNDILRNALSNAKEMCHDIAQKHKDLTIRTEILNSENGKLLKDIEKLENLKSLMEINERALAAERSLNVELKADKEAFRELYIMLKDDFQKLNTERESLNILIGTMKNQTLHLQKHNLELSEKLQKYEVLHLTCEENSRKLKRMREERHAEFNGLLNSETVLRQKMADFQRSFKDISYKFETIVLGTAASCDELKVIDCQRTELEELLTLMCIECEEILHSILKWTYRSLQKTEQNKEDQYLGISVYLGANEPPESVLSLDRGSESEFTKDTVGVNMKTWQHQELDDLQLQIRTLTAGIEIALKKCASVDSQCNHVLEMYNINTESNNVLCDRGAFFNVRGLNLVDRTNLMRDMLTKLQGLEKNDAELVVVKDGWNPEDFLEMNSGARITILTCKEKAQKEHKKKASGHSVMLKMRLKLERKLDQKTTDIEFLNTQNKSLQAVLDKEQNLKTEMERKLNKMEALHEALANEKENACTLKFAEEEKCKQLEIEVEKVSSVRQAYETLLEINCKLQSEVDDMKSKMDEEKKTIRHEYEKKLDKLKTKTKALYEEEVEKKTKKSKEESEHLHAMCRFYKDKIWSYENDIGILKSQDRMIS